MTTQLHAQPPLCNTQDALINGSFETLTGTCNSSGCNLAAFNDNPTPPSGVQCDVEGWFAAVGSPNVCTVFSPGGGVTVNPAEGSWFAYCQMDALNCRTEGLIQDISLIPGCKYYLSFQHRSYFVGAQSLDLHIYLANGFSNFSSQSIGNCPIPDPGWTHVTTISGFNQNNWTGSGQISFMAGSVNKQLLIWPELNGSNSDVGYWFIDDVSIELCESSITPAFTYDYIYDGTYQFTDETTGSINAWCWDFGDGSYSELQNPQHTFTTAGPYEVCLTISDSDGCKNTACQQVNPICPGSYDHEITGPVTSLQNLINNYPSIFGSTSITNKNIFVSGTLDVDVSSYLISDCNFYMDAGAQINIDGNKVLTIEDSHLHGCDVMWKGIMAGPLSIINMKNSELEDAQYGIYSNRANISLLDCRFNRNFIGLYSPPGFTYAHLNAFSGNDFDCDAPLKPEFTGWVSASDVPAHSNKFTFAGVWVYDVQGVFAVGIGSQNMIRNLTNGFVVRGSNMDIRNTRFKNIVNQKLYNGYLQGYAIYGSGNGQVFTQQGSCFSNNTVFFENCNTGIYLEGMHAKVRNNEMTDVVTGIYVRKSANFDIDICGNVINATLHGISLYYNDPAERIWVGYNRIRVAPLSPDSKAAAIFVRENGAEQPNARIEFHENINIFNAGAGISVNGANGYAVEQNFIEAGALGNLNYAGFNLSETHNSFLGCNFVNGDYETNSSGNINGPFGIRARASTNVLYECNDVQDTYLGVQFDMGCSDTDFRTTGFDNHRYGLHYTVTGVTGDQPASSSGDLYGNRWDGTWGGASSAVGARHENQVPNFVNESNYVVPSISSPFGPENPSSASSGWFDDDPNRDEYSCGTTCNVWVLQDPPVRELDNRIAKGLVDPGIHTDPMQWMLERDLYRKLYRQPDLLQGGTALDTFFTNKTSTTVGQFVEVEAAIRSLFEPDSTTRQQLAAWRTALTGKIEAVAIIDSLLLTATGQDSLDLLVERLDTLALLDSLSQLNATLVDSLLQYRAAQADSVIVQNNAISVSDIWEENEKDVNRIFLATLAKGGLPDSTQLAQLQYIAGQCPYEGGTAVFRARAILSGLTEDVFDDESLCSPPDSEELMFPHVSFEVNASTIQVHPNPAKSTVTIDLDNETGPQDELWLVNLYGQKVLQHRLPEKSLTFTFSVQSVESGVYFLKIFGNGQEKSSHRLVIIR